jgi:transposase
MKNEVSIESLMLENAALKAELAEVKQKLSWFMEQLSSSKRKLYGISSEKSEYDGKFVQTGLFSDDRTIINEYAAPAETNTPPREKPRKKGELSTRLPLNLPVETVECVLPDDEQACGVCGNPLHEIGKEVVRKELKIIPAKAIVVEYVRHAYSCRNCEQTAEKVPIVKAPLPPQVIKGSICAPETLAHIAVQKCVMGSPLYRQEQEWRRDGIRITRQTMANWMIRCCEDYLEPIYDELHRQLLGHRFLHSDDTVFQVLREPGKSPQSDSRMWLYRTSGEAKHPIVLYEYQPDRRQERPRNFLKGFSGYLMTDAYIAYHNLPDDIIVVGCFAHVRSRFTDALKCLKEDKRRDSLAFVGKKFCDDLFGLEQEIMDKSFDERFNIRNEKAVPILESFHDWLKSVEPHVSCKSKLGSAIGYSLRQWNYLIRYLLDGRIEMSNNRAERSVKPFVINRKNFLFSTSVEGAKATAIFHSITETAKESGLNPFKYIAHVLQSAAARDIRNDVDLLLQLLPENVPDFCRAIL